MDIYAHVTGWGMAVPERVLTNEDLSRLVDTTDEWITSRTGIRERHIASGKETTLTLAVEAAQAALEEADLDPDTLDLIIVATSTPENMFPSTACLVQDALGATKAGAFDLSAACSGFVYALAMASQSIRSGAMKNILIIGAETLSRAVDWKDRGTCILFGDGAGAIVLQASATPGGVLSTLMRSDGSGASSLVLPAGVGRVPQPFAEHGREHSPMIYMDGKEVYRFATRVMASATKEVVHAAGLTLADIALIVPHQANKRIVESAARSLGLSEDKFVLNVERYGNTSAASIPIALCEAVAQNRVRSDDHLVLVGFGGGLTWSAAVIKWHVVAKPEVSRWHRLARQTGYFFSRVRSLFLRFIRRLEGLFYGKQINDDDPNNRRR